MAFYARPILLIFLTLQTINIFSQNDSFFSDSIRAREINSKANDLGRQGLHIQALDSFFIGLELRKDLYGNENRHLGPVYSGIGIQYRALGQNDLAFKYFKLAERNYLKGISLRTDPRIRLYRNIGNLFRSNLDFKQALEYYQQALSISFSQTNYPKEEIAFTNYGIAELYYVMNDYDKALEIINENIENAYAEDQISYFELLAFISQIRGENMKAKSNYLKAIESTIAIYEKKDLNVAIQYLSYAHFLTNSGEFEESEDILKEAFEVITLYQPEEGNELSDYYQLKAELYRFHSVEQKDAKNFSIQKTQHLEAAIILYLKALKALNFMENNSIESPNSSDKWYSQIGCINLLKEIADTYSEMANNIFDKESPNYLYSLQGAIKHYQLASSIIQKARKELSSDESKIQLTELEHSTFNKLVQTAYLAYSVSDDPKYVEFAFQGAERIKSSSVFDQLTHQSAQENSLIPDSLLQLEKRINSIISIYSEKLYEENSYDEPDTSLINNYGTVIFKAKRDREELNRFFESEYPDYFDLKYSASLLLISDIQNKLKDDEVILEYIINGKDSLPTLYTFLISRNDKQFFKHQLTDKFYGSIDSVFSFMSNPEYMLTTNKESLKYCQSAYYLYSNLIEPFEEKIYNKQLIIIPDGKLSYIPFDALLTDLPDTTKNIRFDKLNYLIKQYSINYSNSANLLFKLKSSSKKLKNKVIAFAPEYNADSIEIANQFYTLSPLPGVQKEVDIISKTVKTKLYKGKDATEENFRNEIEKFDILHLAMHAFINDSLPSFSKLAFSQNNSNDLLSDGSINTADIYNLDLDARLAVLSACNTGRGKLRKGEGIMSLARGFFYAGCPSIVMSLWEVEDQSGTEIMGSFYKNLKKGKTKNEALRLAKLEYLESSNSRRAHPHYWLSYISLGNNSPLYKSYDFYFFIVLIVLLAAIVTDQIYKMKKARKKRAL